MQNETHQIWGLVLLIILLVTMGATISIVLILNQKKFHFKKKLVKVESDFQKSMLLTQLEIQEQTFQQISREIHDHIGQRLSLARLYINEYSSHSDSDQLDSVHESSSLIEEAISDLKQLSRSLTANLIRDEGLLHALKLEINRVNKVTSIDINFFQEGDLPFMSSENELILFRIIQESLQNIIRHAEASKVDIHLIHCTEQLSLIIKDDGKGFDPEAQASPKPGTGAGLANMRNRAALLQGAMKIIAQPGQGTTLQFIFPQPNLISKDANS
ncbi:MAG: sensor histidine kinase [Bacteroidetes bacterium]|nr:sensor histidine kinase [Bacteroidota bacterium]